jgi:LuxR family maltose regulon positive regulatory protein
MLPAMVKGVPAQNDTPDAAALAPVPSPKYALPTAPPAMVVRAGLIDRLAAADGPAVVSIVAPGGYGKTTLLRQWADQSPNTAYVGIEQRDNDPVVLMTAIATALDRVEPIDPAVLSLLASPGRSVESTLMPALVESIWARHTPTLLMLDDVHRVSAAASLDVISFLMLHLPPGTRLALSARRVRPFPFARLRVAGNLLELDAQDLALDSSAAHVMARHLGIEVSPEEVVELVARTEGWPAATYLGLRSMGSSRGADRPVEQVRGTERSIADYIQLELLEPLDPDAQRWLLRSSVLDTMTGPLCDAALETTGSLARLRQLEQRNLLVVPLDAHRAAYRYHRLFRDLLRDEIELRDAGDAATVRRRAAAWCAEHDEPGAAVEYAYASGDMDLVARLVVAYAFPMHWSGRTATLARWLDWFDRDDERGKRPAIAILAGWIHAMEGRTGQARQWVIAAEGSPDHGPMPDGASRGSWLAVLRGCMASAGFDRLRSDASLGLEEIPEGSPFRQTALTLAGLADMAAGSLDTADQHLAEAADISEARRSVPGLALALGERAIIALSRGDLSAASQHVERGLAAVREAGMEDEVLTVTLHAAAARTALADGSPSGARLAIAQVQRMRPRVTAALPILALQMRFETIRACILLREAAAARALLLEVRDILRLCPDLGALVHEAADLQRAVEAMRESAAGPYSLTTAELRVLAYLPTHLSFREIADRLYVSPHTIKSQATAVYGKLGVSSRRSAIEEAVQAGLLDASVMRMPGASTGVA